MLVLHIFAKRLLHSQVNIFIDWLATIVNCLLVLTFLDLIERAFISISPLSYVPLKLFPKVRYENSGSIYVYFCSVLCSQIKIAMIPDASTRVSLHLLVPF